MDKLLINGCKPLTGEVRISGSKNAVLPILAASLLANEPVRLFNVPHLQDVITIIELLGQMGAHILMDEKMSIEIDTSDVNHYDAPYELVKKMRASILVLGPLLAKYKKAKVSLPGGCAIGARPVNLHLKGLTALGADIHVENGYIIAEVPDRLRGTTIVLENNTVTGTENLMMAACLAEGETILKNAAREPEIVDLAMFLNKIGAHVEGAGTSTIKIQGVKELKGGEYRILPDRIEAGTFLTAAAATKGHVVLRDIQASILESVLLKLEEAGAYISTTDNSITLDMKGNAPYLF